MTTRVTSQKAVVSFAFSAISFIVAIIAIVRSICVIYLCLWTLLICMMPIEPERTCARTTCSFCYADRVFATFWLVVVWQIQAVLISSRLRTFENAVPGFSKQVQSSLGWTTFLDSWQQPWFLVKPDESASQQKVGISTYAKFWREEQLLILEERVRLDKLAREEALRDVEPSPSPSSSDDNFRLFHILVLVQMLRMLRPFIRL